MNYEFDTYQVAIVGGGPVGLFLACCLHQADISCIVLEKRTSPVTHSRSIGIHPVSLELFETIGLANAVVAEGIKVKEGLAFCNEKQIGTLSFQSCPAPFPFILTVPQYKTERLLAACLEEMSDDILHRNCLVNKIEEVGNGVQLTVSHDGTSKQLLAEYVIGCDGKNSFTRQAAGIPFTGINYKDTYIMGDFSDNTSLGSAAAIFLCSEGLIESFPLSQKMRRWVVKTNHYLSTVNRYEVETRIHHRIGHDLSATENIMLSSFGVQKKFAGTMAKSRVILAGDAAHVISPIGGQGMNLGWLDARDLTHCLKKVLSSKAARQQALQNYSTRRLKIARKAARRAEFNMAMGRKNVPLFFKKVLLLGLLKTPASHLMAYLFTMHGLRTYPF